MIEPRSEEAGASGLLTLSMDGRTFEVPVLKLRHSRKWKALAGPVVGSVDLPTLAEVKTAKDAQVMIGSLANVPADIALELVLAYDTACDTRPGVLGGREAFEDMATDRELYAALELMVSATYPFGKVLRSVVEEFGPQLRLAFALAMQQLATTLSREPSTSGPSPTGGSTPTPLRSVSPTSSSSSSGATARSGSRTKRASG